MNDAGRKKLKIWGGIIEYDEPVPDPTMEAFKAAIDAGANRLEQHKGALLDHLQKQHEQGPKSEPFDADKSWEGLTRLAYIYFWVVRIRQEVVPAAHRVERLRDLATALRHARGKVGLAMQDDVGDDLFRAWRDANVRYDPDLDPTGPLTLVRIDHEFEKVIASLAASLASLETAARRAADEVPKARGRPKGSAILSGGFIEGLAGVYQNSTGSKPGAGDGPFARFVYEFLIAIGRDTIEYESLVDAIKDTRARLRTRPPAAKSGPSPFDDET
jgi:hypothetical protein